MAECRWQVLYPGTACINIHHTSHNTVGTECKDQGRNAHHRNTPAIKQTNQSTDHNTSDKCYRPVLSITEHTGHYCCNKSKVRTYGYIDLTNKYRECHSCGYDNINNTFIKAGDDIICRQECRIDNSYDCKQSNQEKKTAEFSGFNYLFHASTSVFFVIPKEAAIRLS